MDTSSTDTTDDEPADSGSDDEADAADEPEESTDTVELIEVDESEAAVFGGTLRYCTRGRCRWPQPRQLGLLGTGFAYGRGGI